MLGSVANAEGHSTGGSAEAGERVSMNALSVGQKERQKTDAFWSDGPECC